MADEIVRIGLFCEWDLRKSRHRFGGRDIAESVKSKDRWVGTDVL